VTTFDIHIEVLMNILKSRGQYQLSDEGITKIEKAESNEESKLYCIIVITFKSIRIIIKHFEIKKTMFNVC
jgi:hypothetical protein